MNRRSLVAVLSATVSSLFATSESAALEGENKHSLKIAYHLADIEKVDFCLGSIANHLSALQSEKPEIVLVVHGPALHAFTPQGSTAHRRRLTALVRDGVAAKACANTMRGMGVQISDLAEGFAEVPSGVITLADLQAKTYSYLRP